ncbi:MAG: translocation protein TolB [Acidobacteria bacterium]|nr:translocation protein TolB [Acidobacteriota bacterium]
MPSQALADLIRSGVELNHADAVALIQELVSSHNAEVDAVPPFGPPTVENVFLSSDGTVVCRACATTPAVSEIAKLLESLFPTGAKMPGALRYTLARAFLDVDAPPFDSLADFSAALTRHEPADRRSALRALYARGAAPHAASPAVRLVTAAGVARGNVEAPIAETPAVEVERRTAAMSVAELRSQLREAEAQLFASRTRAPQWALGGAMAALIAFGAGYAAMRSVPHAVAPPRPAAASTVVTAAPPAPNAAPRPSRDVAAAEPPTPHVPVAAPPRDVPVHGTSGSAPTKRAVHQPALVRAVAPSAGPAFSPAFASNGSALFFHSGRSTDGHSAIEAAPLDHPDLGVMTIVDDGAKNYHVQPSPDGTRVAFDSDRDGERGVYVAYRDGSGVRRVSGAGYAAVPTWSPDGKRLAFIRGEADRPKVWNLWLLDLGSRQSRRLTSFRYGQTWSASWFADGRRICYTHEDRLIVANLDTGVTREYPSPVSHTLMRTPAVSPDGRRVIFQVARSGAWMLDLEDGSTQRVLADPTAEEFAWSPDGRRVAFHSRRDGQWSIWLLDRLTS